MKPENFIEQNILWQSILLKLKKTVSVLKLKFSFESPSDVIHTYSRKDAHEIISDKSSFCTFSTFKSIVDVYDEDIELELKYYASRDWLLSCEN